MAITFPRSVGSFWNALRFNQFDMVPEIYQSSSGTRGGEVLTAEIAEPKWRIDASIVSMTISEAEIWRSRFNAMTTRGSDGTFIAYDVRRDGPMADRDGSEIAGFTPTVLGLSGRTGIRFAGLPADYVITSGDFFSIAYGTNPVRYALMQAAESVVANGSGQTAFIDVTPFIKSGITTGLAVDFVNARVKMMVREFNPGVSDLIHVRGMSLTAIEAF